MQHGYGQCFVAKSQPCKKLFVFDVSFLVEKDSMEYGYPLYLPVILKIIIIFQSKQYDPLSINPDKIMLFMLQREE